MENVTINPPTKEFIVNKNSWYMKLYIFLRADSYLPTDSCKLRRGIIATFFMFLITAPLFLIIKLIDRKLDNEMSLAVPLALTVIGIIIASIPHGPEINDVSQPYLTTILDSFNLSFIPNLLILWFIVPIIGILIFTIAIGLIGVIAYFIYTLYEMLPKRETDSTITKLYKDAKNKVCTKVKYVDDTFV